MPRAAILLILVLAVPMALPASAAERPGEGRCDATGRLVCAAASVGGQASCRITPDFVAACSWTAGSLWEAYSPLGLPGDGDMTTRASWSTCVTGRACEVVPASASAYCGFSAVMVCGGDAPLSGDVGPRVLALGQCLTITIEQVITVDARVVTSGPTVASATWTDTSTTAASVCAVDDGR